MKDSDVRNRFVELRASGWSFARIAAEIGVSKPTLIKWSQEEYAALDLERFCRAEEFAERLGLLRQKRMETFGALLARARAELETRDFSGVPTERLLALTLALERRVGEELAGIRYVAGGVDGLFEQLDGLKLELSAL